MKKRGTILVENIIFIILNLIFLVVLILFLVNQGSGIIVLEETYAKQIAMIIDSSQPVMLIKMDMEKGLKIAEDNGINFNDAVSIDGNIVNVDLDGNGGYSYAFFNNVDAKAYVDTDDSTKYIITINKKIDAVENEGGI
jgi:hypothetical protein